MLKVKHMICMLRKRWKRAFGEMVLIYHILKHQASRGKKLPASPTNWNMQVRVLSRLLWKVPLKGAAGLENRGMVKHRRSIRLPSA